MTKLLISHERGQVFAIWLCLVLFIFTVGVINAQKVDKVFGFKKIRLEMPVDSLLLVAGGRHVEKDDVYDMYEISHTEYFQFGKCRLSRVHVLTFREKVLMISMDTRESRCMLKALTKQFGKATWTSKVTKTYEWKGNKALASYTEKANKEGLAKISIITTHLKTEVDEYESNKNKKAADSIKSKLLISDDRILALMEWAIDKDIA